MKKDYKVTTRSVDDTNMPFSPSSRRARLGVVGNDSIGTVSVGSALFETPVRGREASNRESPSPLRSALEWVAVVGGAIFVAVVVRTFILQVFFIPSESMDPTLQVKDKVVVDKLSHHFSNVGRGQLVVFTRPTGLSDSGIKDLVKRVMAVEGDTIEAVDGQVYVNGDPVNESYLKGPLSTVNLPATTIGAGQLWVMGDNRQNSSDSRTFGSIPESSVVGYARAVIWPLNHASWLAKNG